MGDIGWYVLAGMTGWVLGVIFFGGLLWTVRKVVSSPAPARWLLSSALLRMSVTLLGFYLVSGGSWQRMIACLIGFLAGRLSVFWMTRSTEEAEPHAT